MNKKGYAITPKELFRFGIWFLFGFGAWLIYSSLEKLISLQPINAIITGVFVIFGLLFLFKLNMLPL